MGDPFKKVQRGDRLRIQAETFNTFIDAAKDFRYRTQNRGGRSQAEWSQTGIILVKNSKQSTQRIEEGGLDARAYSDAVVTYLAFAIDQAADYWSAICSWHTSGRRCGTHLGVKQFP